MTRRRKIALALALALGVPVGVGYAVATVTAGGREARVRHERTGAGERRPGAVLEIMTLNLAHGRGDGRNQLLVSTKTIKGCLDKVAGVLEREAPHVVAVQEADGPSFWSGGFDHVEAIARKAGFISFARAENVRGLRLAYGTGVMASVPLEDPVGVSFPPTPPTFSKGFCMATVPWEGSPTGKVRVVSVHLDFARASARSRQLDLLAARLEKEPRPWIVLGDFNCRYAGAEDGLRRFVERLSLRAYRPDDGELTTFPGLDRRIDWILLTDELRFRRYETLEDAISDHRAVIAEVEAAGSF